MTGAATVHDTVAIAIAISHTVAPLVGDLAVARLEVRSIRTGAFGDVGLCMGQV